MFVFFQPVKRDGRLFMALLLPLSFAVSWPVWAQTAKEPSAADYKPSVSNTTESSRQMVSISENGASEPTDTIAIRRHQAQVEVGALVSSSGQTPYWLQTNQFGIIPKTAPAGLLIATLQSDYRNGQNQKRPRIDWGYGVQVVGQGSDKSQILLAEAYGKLRVGIFELSAGRRKQIVGLADSPLSSGAFIWSGNALPLPQVILSIPEYWSPGFTKGWIAFKGQFGHGWFGKGPYVQNSYLHHKSIFVRLGRPQSLFRLYGAFTHYAQWAGYAAFLEREPTYAFEGYMAQSFEAYVNVVLPFKTDALKNTSKFATFDQNRVGDHRGSAEFAIDLRLPHGTLTTYQQHFYDLGRKLYNLRNIEDGLYGLRYQSNRERPWLSEAVFELFNSGNQGVLQFGKPLGGEWENYFLNGQYPEGWSYRGRTLGTPFMSQTADVNPTLPSVGFSGYTLDNRLIEGRYGINNNRVWALHAGLSGNIGRLWGYRTKVTYSRNYGLFRYPFPDNTNQLSCLLSITKSLRRSTGSTIFASVGYDQGKLLKNPQQLGAYVGWQKTWGNLFR